MTAADFKRLFLPQAETMHKTAWHLTGNVQEAEDLVQEVFLTLWTKRDNLEVGSNVTEYCLATVRNIYINTLRRKGKLDISPSPVENDAGYPSLATDDLMDSLIKRDAAERMLALIHRLPEAQRIIVTLRDVEGLPYDEIAAATNLSEGNIRVLLSRARKQLREQFKLLENYEHA